MCDAFVLRLGSHLKQIYFYLIFSCLFYFLARAYLIDYDGQCWFNDIQENRGDKSSRNRNGTIMLKYINQLIYLSSVHSIIYNNSYGLLFRLWIAIRLLEARYQYWNFNHFEQLMYMKTFFSECPFLRTGSWWNIPKNLLSHITMYDECICKSHCVCEYHCFRFVKQLQICQSLSCLFSR